MRRVALCLGLLAALPGCPGPEGRELPRNLGMSHDREEGAGGEAQQPAEPVEVGTNIWADYRHTGLFFYGVVVERREEQHRVIYADGASEWLEASSLRPDALSEGARVHVRPGFDQEFAEGVVARRVGSAVYVRFASGEERWTALPQVRFPDNDESVPRRGDDPYEFEAEGRAPGAMVLVNYHRQGLQFAGIVTAVREDGRIHIVYLDAEQEWVESALVVPDALAAPGEVHIRRRWEPPVWVRGRVQERIGHAFRVELDDGGMAWTSLFRVRRPVPRAVAAQPTEEDDPPSEDAD